MTASALNIASVAPNAAAGLGQAGSAAGAAPGGKAGFEALLAAMFPQAANMPAPVAMGEVATVAPVLVKGQLLVAEAEGDVAADAEPAKTDAAGEPIVADAVAPDATAEALVAAAVVTAPVQPQAQATAPVDSDAPAPQAFGREKPKSAVFQPAIPHTTAAVDGEDVAVDAADVDAAMPQALNTPAPQRAATSTAPAPRAAQAAAPANAAPAPTAAAAPTPDTVDVAIAPPPPATDTPVETAQAPAVQAQALAAGQVAPKAEAPAQPAARPARAERGKATVSETTAREPEFAALGSADKPATAKAATAAAKPAAASVEAAAPEAVEGREAQAETPDATPLADTRAATQQAAPAAHTTHAVRGSPETVAHLAANIVKKLEGQSTRFDLELNPNGLGKVDVRVEIGASGQISAAMLFDSPEAAQELKARAAELQRALEQAGFDLSGGLSFDVAGESGRQGQAWQEQGDNDTGRAFRGQAFKAALETAGEADIASQGPLRLRRGVTAGLDVRI